jgi:hypothetical protein
MQRMQIYLTTVELEKLRNEAKNLGLPTAEYIRRIIDRFFEEKTLYQAKS